MDARSTTLPLTIVLAVAANVNWKNQDVKPLVEPTSEPSAYGRRLMNNTAARSQYFQAIPKICGRWHEPSPRQPAQLAAGAEPAEERRKGDGGQGTHRIPK